jgi:hypothetical protein
LKNECFKKYIYRGSKYLLLAHGTPRIHKANSPKVIHLAMKLLKLDTSS